MVEGAIKTIDKFSPVLCLELPVRNPKELEYYHYMIQYLKQYNYNLKGSLQKEVLFSR